MPKCVFTDSADCVKCVICYPTEYKYKCVNCGHDGTTTKTPIYAQKCDNCDNFIGIKECPKVQVN